MEVKKICQWKYAQTLTDRITLAPTFTGDHLIVDFFPENPAITILILLLLDFAPYIISIFKK